MKHATLAAFIVALLSTPLLPSAGVPAKAASNIVPASYFGLTVLNSTIPVHLEHSTARSWDTRPFPDWGNQNPAKGVYKFSALDQFMAANQGRDMIYTLGRTPRWASSKPDAHVDSGPLGQCAPPADIADWDNYIRAVATRAAGRIKYWEIWNEPQNTDYYCGDIPTMVVLAQHARRIIKGIDPSAMILSPAPNNFYGVPWFASFLSAGGAATVDIIAFHGYIKQNAEDIVTLIAKYKTVMAANGVSNLPLWDTEASGGLFADPDQGAAFLSKYYLLQWSQGVSRFLWYAYDAAPQWGQLWSPTTGPTPAAIAYTQTYNWMVGASMTSPCSKGANDVWTCELSRPNYQAEALWNSHATVQVTVPARFKEYRDLRGNVHPITKGTVSVANSPILIETGPLG